MKITMLGKSGSGKTSFLAGLYEVLGAQSKFDFQLIPRAPTLVDSVIKYGQFQYLSFTNDGLEFPDANATKGETTLWTFDLLHRLHPVEDMAWLDYRGGILDEVTSLGLDKAELEVVLDDLTKSRTAVIFVDSFLLTLSTDLNEARAHTGAGLFNNILETYGLKNPNEHLICLIVLTKVDALETYWVANNYRELLQFAERVFSPIVEYTRSRRRWVTGIVPVSVVGNGNAELEVIPAPDNAAHGVELVTRLVRPPEPQHVEHALFFCAEETFRNYRRQAMAHLAELTDKIAAVENEQRRQNHELPAEPGEKPAGHLHQWRRDYEWTAYLYAGYSYLIDELTTKTFPVITRI